MGCGKNNVGGASEEKGCVCEVVKTILELQNRAVRHHHDCDSCGTSCFVEPLGGIKHQVRNADTRVFMLLNKDGTPFNVIAQVDNDDNGRRGDHDHNDKDDKGGRDRRNNNNCVMTPFFRVEDVFGDCCATLRALAPIGDGEGRGGRGGGGRDDNGDVLNVFDKNGFLDPDVFCAIEDFEKTETCVTVDLERFAAVQCIADVDLNICRR